MRNLLHFDGKPQKKPAVTLADCNWTQVIKNGIITNTLANWNFLTDCSGPESNHTLLAESTPLLRMESKQT